MPVNRADCVLLKDESMGVSTETKARKIQNGDSCRVTLNGDWVDQLNLSGEGSQTVHSLSMGIKPVIVQNPAIIVQPASIIGGDSHD
jgi:hypothetical protein